MTKHTSKTKYKQIYEVLEAFWYGIPMHGGARRDFHLPSEAYNEEMREQDLPSHAYRHTIESTASKILDIFELDTFREGRWPRY